MMMRGKMATARTIEFDGVSQPSDGESNELLGGPCNCRNLGCNDVIRVNACGVCWHLYCSMCSARWLSTGTCALLLAPQLQRGLPPQKLECQTYAKLGGSGRQAAEGRGSVSLR